MSFRGGSRGGRGTGSRGGGSFGGRGGEGPVNTAAEMGTFLHPCEGELVCQSTNSKIPYFNAPIYLENKTMIGKVDEILGPINQVYFTIKGQEGIVATSFKPGDKFYIGPDKLLPLEKWVLRTSTLWWCTLTTVYPDSCQNPSHRQVRGMYHESSCEC
ncbi:Gar1/Naf1 RNA binding region-domain-containing protein [Cryomyces antarcticus]